MRYRALTVVALTMVTSVLARAQSVDPKRVAAGADVTITQECKAAKPAIALLDTTEVTGSGTSPKWSFKIPATLAAKTYAVKFRCPTEPVKETDAGSLEVTAAAQTPSGSTALPTVVSVVNVTKASLADDKTPATGAASSTAKAAPVVSAELKDVLKIKVRNLNGKTPLHLFLAGIELKNVATVPTAPDPGDAADLDALLVTLETENDKEGIVRKAWVHVLQAAMNRSRQASERDRQIDISVGQPDQAPFRSDAAIVLKVFPWYTGWVVALLVAIALGVIWLGYSSSMLRDSNGAANPPYSLAKHQMAIWFVVVVGAYLYVWLITGLFSSISNTALILIGISGATGLVAVAMDGSKRTDAAKNRIALAAERDALDHTLNDPATGLQTQLRAAAPASPAAVELSAAVMPKLARLQELDALLRLPAPIIQHNDQWLNDLLSDDQGISFHRLQMAVWTLVLAIVFIASVYNDILMPDFDNTLLGLMGISSGTYLGFKFPEKAA